MEEWPRVEGSNIEDQNFYKQVSKNKLNKLQ